MESLRVLRSRYEATTNVGHTRTVDAAESLCSNVADATADRSSLLYDEAKDIQVRKKRRTGRRNKRCDSELMIDVGMGENRG